MNRIIIILIVVLIACDCFAQPSFIESYPDTLNKKRLYSVIASETGIYLAGLSYLSFIWYKDQKRVPFHYYDDSKGYLQMDKAGHVYGAYRYTYAAYYALRWAGVDRKKALLYGGPIGLIFQTPIGLNQKKRIK